MPLMTLANEAATGTAIGAEAWKSVLTAMTSQISVTTVVGVLASVVGFAIALVSGRYSLSWLDDGISPFVYKESV